MKRYALFIIVVICLLLSAVSGMDYLTRAQTQANEKTTSAARVPSATQPTGSTAPELPVRTDSGSDRLSAPPVTKPALQCQGCHAAGKALPYLGGALFHAEPHKAYDHGFHARGVQNGKKAATCLDCHTVNGDMTTILPAGDPKSTINRLNLAMTCGRCHGDSSVMRGTSISNRPFLSYQESVHARAMSRGNTSAAVCTDCHSGHDILPASDAQSPISKSNVPTTCGKCHASIATEFNQSVHGQAVMRGVSRAPVCTDCHGIHSIKQPTEPGTSTATQAMATGTCTQCHESVALTQEFGVAGQRVSSYKDSYHGLASTAGSKLVANCASCHGVHNILPSSDPRSMVNASNLQQTCGQCHPGATMNFANGKVHLNVAARDMGSVGTRWVRRIYLPLIVLVIGGMVFHNALIWRKKAARRRKEQRTIVRLSRNQRVQHWLLLTSFITLVISGFALQYPDWWLAWLLGSSEVLRRVIHRVAAVVMLVVGAYHIGYLALTSEGRQWVKDMLPKVKDVKDVLQNFTLMIRLPDSRPRPRDRAGAELVRRAPGKSAEVSEDLIPA